MKSITIQGNEKLLFFTASGIGDTISNLGIINSIKNKYPRLKIDIVVTQNGIKKLVDFNKAIAKTIKLNFESFSFWGYTKYFLYGCFGDIILLNKQKYDILICPNIGLLRKFLIRALLCPNKIILGKGPHDVLKEYSILRILNIRHLSKEPILSNINNKNLKISQKIKSTINPNKKNVIINMFCADSPSSIRDWSKWDKLVNLLSQKYNLILVGEVNFDYKKHYRLNYSKVSNLINKTTLEDIIYLIKESDLVISVDSSIFHFAYAIGARVIGLFGPVNPKMRIPPVADKKKIWAMYLKKSCSPCLLNKHINFFQLYQ